MSGLYGWVVHMNYTGYVLWRVGLVLSAGTAWLPWSVPGWTS
jgi:hypothetical protein